MNNNRLFGLYSGTISANVYTLYDISKLSQAKCYEFYS